MTSSVTIYHIPKEHLKKQISNTPCCINIIDTPGFGDTRGPVWDKKIFTMIGALLGSGKDGGLEHLNYILLTVKATDNRLSPSSKYIYDNIQNLYAADLSERMMGMFTFSDGGIPAAYEAIKAAKIPLKEENIFKFNNSAMWSC